MEKYIITFEDGQHYIADTYTDDDLAGLESGVLTIIRLSDGKELHPDLSWSELPKWGEF